MIRLIENNEMRELTNGELVELEKKLEEEYKKEKSSEELKVEVARCDLYRLLKSINKEG